jgi:hypothetical protein
MAILFPLRGLWLEKHVGLTVANTRYYSLIPIMSDTEIYPKFRILFRDDDVQDR